jgi:hypothetical protein
VLKNDKKIKVILAGTVSQFPARFRIKFIVNAKIVAEALK